MRSGGTTVPISNAKLIGDQINFTARGVKYSGHVSGNSMEGDSGNGKWTATRVGS
jgi:hypothetical protein